MTILVIEPGKYPYVKEINDKGALETMQEIVGGFIECIYPFSDNVALVMNEEGKLMSLPLNRSIYDSFGKMYDVISGNFFVVGLSRDNFKSLTLPQINRYKDMYRYAEHFSKTYDGNMTMFTTESVKV